MAQLAGKESACNAEYLALIPGLGRSPGEGNGYSLQYSGLENSMDGTVHGVTKSQTQLSDFQFQRREYFINYQIKKHVNFQMFNLDLEKAEEPEIKLPTSVGSSKKQESSRKTSTSALLTMPKAFDCVVHNTL